MPLPSGLKNCMPENPQNFVTLAFAEKTQQLSYSGTQQLKK
jgi:hypothetical protein